MEQVLKARSHLVLDEPFFGMTSLKFELVEDKDCLTAWTDGKKLGYNPNFIEMLNPKETVFIIAHETMHCILEHFARLKDRDIDIANQAMDYVINIILYDANFTIPKGALLDFQYRDMAYEQVYEIIKAKQAKKQKEDKKQDKQDDSKGQGQGKEGKEDKQDQKGQGNGSSSNQNKEDLMAQAGEVRTPKSEGNKKEDASSSEVNQQVQEWHVAADQAMKMAQAMGNMPGNLTEIVNALKEAKVDWKDVLRRFIDTTAKNDYNFTKPNRRHIGRGFCLPTLYNEEMGPIIVLYDSSGSTWLKEILERFATELTAIINETNAECHVVYVDTEVRHKEVFTKEDLPIEFHPQGGGGTDFRPGFEWIEYMDIMPSCVIYLTDLQCSRYPLEAPLYPVLWAQVGTSIYSRSYSDVPFGEVVSID